MKRGRAGSLGSPVGFVHAGMKWCFVVSFSYLCQDTRAAEAIPKVTYLYFREVCWTSVSHSGHTVGLSLTDNFDLEKLEHCRNPK